MTEQKREEWLRRFANPAIPFMQGLPYVANKLVMRNSVRGKCMNVRLTARLDVDRDDDMVLLVEHYAWFDRFIGGCTIVR